MTTPVRLLDRNYKRARALTHAKSELAAVAGAMAEAASEIASWAGRFVPLEEVGISGEQAQTIKETW